MVAAAYTWRLQEGSKGEKELSLCEWNRKTRRYRRPSVMRWRSYRACDADFYKVSRRAAEFAEILFL